MHDDASSHEIEDLCQGDLWVDAGESGCVGTNLEPQEPSRVPSPAQGSSSWMAPLLPAGFCSVRRIRPRATLRPLRLGPSPETLFDERHPPLY